MASIARDIVDLLTSLFPAETIKGGFLSDGEGVPNRMVAVGVPPGDEPPAETFVGTQGPKINMELPVVLIHCRGEQDDQEEAMDLADSIYVALHNLMGTTVNGHTYKVLEAQQPPYSLGSDDEGRWMYGFNLRCWKVH